MSIGLMSMISSLAGTPLMNSSEVLFTSVVLDLILVAEAACLWLLLKLNVYMRSSDCVVSAFDCEVSRPGRIVRAPERDRRMLTDFLSFSWEYRLVTLEPRASFL